MKIIGLIVSWGNERWIDLVIKQALYACDEVIISIGPHSSVMGKYGDKSMEIAKTYGDRVKIVGTVSQGNHSRTKAATMNTMLKVSDNYVSGNWVWLLDDDEFWHEEDIDKMKEIASTGKYNHIFTNEKFFYVDMKHYLINKNGRGRFWKIEQNDHRFVPTNNWTGPRDKVHHMGCDMFHYSLLMNPYAKIDFWGSEYSHGQNHKVQWVKDVYLEYDLNDEEKYLNICKEKFGYYNPFPMGKGNFYGDNGKLLTYDGKHPKLIEECEFTKIKDFRDIYK